MFSRIRSSCDVTGFLVRAEWAPIVSVGSFLLGLIPMVIGVPQEIGWGFAALGFVIGAIFIIRDTFGLLGRWSSLTMRRVHELSERLATAEVPDLPEVVVTPTGRVAINPELDALLATAENQVRWHADPYRLPTELAKIAPYVLRTSAQGKWPFDGPNVRLETDLTIESVSTAADMMMRPGSFFRAVCSNELTGWHLKDDGKSWDFEGTYLLDSRERVIPLGQSRLMNGVGVSTLAVTTDDKLLVVLQSPNTQTGAGMWAASGSGALEPKDLPRQEEPLLRDMVVAGAVRELREETKLPASAIGNSRVLRYGRWLDRGGKPEFSCVTALTISSDEVELGSRMHRIGSDERLWTAEIQLLGLNLAVPSTNEPTVKEPPLWLSSQLVSDPDELRGSTSVSLGLALDALVRALVRDPHLFDELRSAQPVQ